MFSASFTGGEGSNATGLHACRPRNSIVLSRDAELSALLIVFCEFDARDGSPMITDAACCNELYTWASSNDPSSLSLLHAVAALPLVEATSVTSDMISDFTRSVDLVNEPIRVALPTINLDGNCQITGLIRLNVYHANGATTSAQMLELFREYLTRYSYLDALDCTVPLMNIAQAAHHNVISSGSHNLLRLANGIARAATEEPFARVLHESGRVAIGEPFARGLHARVHDTGRHFMLDDSHSLGYIKRTPWSKSPAADICSFLPQWSEGMTLKAFHFAILTCLHTPIASRVPDLVREDAPFATITQAIMTAHKSITEIERILSIPMVSQRICDCIDKINSKSAAEFDDCRAYPSDVEKQERVIDWVSQFLVDVRAACDDLDCSSMLKNEANHLLALIDSDFDYGDIDDVDYMYLVDRAWSQHVKLWGGTYTLAMCRDSTLAEFMPCFVARLNSHHQERALKYLNDYIVPLEKAGSGIDERLRLELQRSLSGFRSSPMMRSSLCAIGAGDRTGRFRGMDTHGVKFDILRQPTQLRFVANLGFLISHWRPFFVYVIGTRSSHPSSIMPEPSVFGNDGKLLDV